MIIMKINFFLVKSRNMKKLDKPGRGHLVNPVISFSLVVDKIPIDNITKDVTQNAIFVGILLLQLYCGRN
jgi:hypothetical protein